MPRAHRYFLPGYIWHITHRCHEKSFLLKFARDRRRWIRWLFEARKRYGLRVLDFIATSNHVHLLVEDRGKGEIARSMQLAAGRVAQEYNRRKMRRGAFWEDRYHATAVDSEGYLARCLTYIDLNMVRAGAVHHPRDWPESGYRELQSPPRRYRLTNIDRLMDLLGVLTLGQLQKAREAWVAEALSAGPSRRSIWSEGIAAGSEEFVEEIKAKLGHIAIYRGQTSEEGICTLGEPDRAYSVHFAPKMVPLRAESQRIQGQ